MFTVEDIDDTLARLRKHGAELVGEVVQYEDTYRLLLTLAAPDLRPLEDRDILHVRKLASA